MRSLVSALVLIIGLGITLPASAQIPGLGDLAGLDPRLPFRELETPHFILTFDKHLEPQARSAAVALESVHELYVNWLKWRPGQKTYVLLVDNTDSANGFASANFRLGLTLFLTPPDNWSALYHYDDWIKILAIHEYLHFVNMDTAHGFWQVFRYLLGDLALPNALWPRWMLEGLAVYAETRFSTAGRGRSAYLDMVLRAAVREKRFDASPKYTLDRVHGPEFPYAPGGEIPYLFGYELMNHVARVTKPGLSSDGATDLRDGDDTLGEMSYRSGGRIPYLIGGNLDNLIGKSWGQLFQSWKKTTIEKQSLSLAQIRTQTPTDVKTLVGDGFEILGCRVSPNGKHILYSQDSAHRRVGLYRYDIEAGETKKLHDQAFGVGKGFTPDSKYVVVSALRRRSPWRIWSELAAVNVRTGAWTWISNGLRAKDPDVSPDGKQIVFTRTAKSTTFLQIATVTGKYPNVELTQIQTLFMPLQYGRVATPRFSTDGSRVAFTIHENGKNEEELAEIDLASRSLYFRFSNGRYQRFPEYANGELFVVSELSGVDNLYRVRTDPLASRAANEVTLTPVTHLETGVWTPCFGQGQWYGSVFSSSGFNLARLGLKTSDGLSTSQSSPLPKLEALSAPSPAVYPDSAINEARITSEAKITESSLFKSLAPRVWFPLIYSSGADGFNALAQVIGFDTADRLRYILTAGYKTETGKPDFGLNLTIRKFGPQIDLGVSNQYLVVSRSLTTDKPTAIGRETAVAAAISYNFEWTFSRLTPRLGASVNHEFGLGADTTVPVVIADLNYSDVETTRLGISPESGRTIALLSRTYQEPSQTNVKIAYQYQEFLRVTPHTILAPRVSGAWVSQGSNILTAGNVILDGRDPYSWGGLLTAPTFGLSGLGLRGYPTEFFRTKSAVQPSAELRIPVARIFKGYRTYPFWLSQLSAFGFGEGTYVPSGINGKNWLPAAGGGLRLTTYWFQNVPIQFSLEYHRGLERSLGGKGEAFAALSFSGIQF